MDEIVAVFFLECGDNPGEAFFIGPYRSFDQAVLRSRSVRADGVEIRQIRRLEAARSLDGKLLVEKTRLFDPGILVPVKEDGSIGVIGRELRLPSDYFENSFELV